MSVKRKTSIKRASLISISSSSYHNMKLELMVKLREWTKETTSHGFSHVTSARHLSMKIIWLICMLVSMSLCSVMIVRSSLDFGEYEVKTKIRQVIENEIDFPMLTICNLNPLVTDQAQRFIYDYFRQNLDKNLANITDKDMADNENIEWLLYTTYHPQFNDTLRKSFGYEMKQLIYSCRFNNKRLNVDDCVESDFKWFYHSVYGNCFKLNSGSDDSGKRVAIRKALLEGEGFELKMFVGFPFDYLTYLYEKESYGIVMFIDECEEKFSLSNNGYFLSPSMHASITLTREKIENLPDPYSSCVNDETFENEFSIEMRKNGLKYSRQNCLMYCKQKLNMEHFQCYDLRLPKFSNSELKPCMFKKTFKKLNYPSYNFTQCNSVCPFACKTTTFDVSISYSNYPSYSSFLLDSGFWFNSLQNSGLDMKSLDYAVYKQTVISVGIYFDHLKTVYATETPGSTLVDLIANIGGTIGLFTGASLLTFVELFELLFDSIFILGRSLRYRN